MSCGGDCGKVAKAVGAIAHGATGIAKALLGVDPVSLPVLNERRAICKSCEKAVPCVTNKANVCWCGPVWDGVWGTRETCGCNIKFKTMVAQSSCPLGKWPAVPAANNSTETTQ